MHHATVMPRVGWRPHSLNPIVAGARYRCLNPLRAMHSQGDIDAELFDPRRAHTYTIVVYQALCVRHVEEDADLARNVLHAAYELRRQGATLVVDECDNHFHNPKGSLSWSKTSANIRSLIDLSDQVVTSTQALANELRSATGTAKPVTVIGDAVESDNEVDFDPAWRRILSLKRKAAHLRQRALASVLRAESSNGVTQLVWFGNHGTSYAEGGMLDLLKVRPLLEQLHKRHPLSLTVISNSEPKYLEHIKPWAIPSRYVTWDRTTFLELLRLHDIALIPITRDPFTVCKSNNRLATALRAGLAVVADSIPSYEAFSSACILDDWDTGLASYLCSPDRRAAHVSAGQALIDLQWTPHHIAQQWQAFFKTLCRSEVTERIAGVDAAHAAVRTK